jgi:hypothetical protein
MNMICTEKSREALAYKRMQGYRTGATGEA